MRKITFIFFLILPFIVLSQNKQPKVGLVLSGGGAKGFAHIGVLKELEKAGVQIDYIAGTSMGAIVGGLYAAGYSATQIEKIIIETDFFTLLQDIYPRRSKPFFEKEHGEKHTIVLPVNKGKISFPKGVSRGKNVLNFLNYLLSPVDSITDFSKLPIPFFCIATDVETGLEVKLTKGSLPTSLRASGSFPTLLDPVEINNKLLIDGGIANNFPIEEMKKTGVDIIIGVDVQSGLFNKENIKSAIDVLSQISSFQIYKDASKKIKMTDVYIHPNIYKYSVVSFDKSKEILLKGKEKAKEFTKVFDSIAALQPKKRKQIEIGALNSKFFLNEIELKGIKDYTRAYVLGKLKIAEGDSVTNKEINLKLGYLLASGNFQNVEYHLRKNGKGKKLLLKVTESKQKARIRLGVHYDFVYQSGVLINYNQKNLFSKNDVFSFNLVVGDKPRYDIQYFVDNGFYYSYGFSTRYNAFKTDAKYNATGINKINLQYTDFTTRGYIQTTFDRKFAFGIGLEHQNITAKT
jgi:NTE family protein